MEGLFDDGSPDVPRGVVTPVRRVVVVGAGIAGLTCANALFHAGIECVVIEARDRLGGRMHTVDLAGSAVDLGASWIHHPDGNPLSRFARESGLTFADGDPLPGMAGFDCAEHRSLTPEEVAANLALLYEEFTPVLEQFRPDDPVSTAAATVVMDALLGREGLTPGEVRRGRQNLRALLEADASDRAERMSLRWMGTEFEYCGDYFGDLPDGGYQSVVTAMAAGLEIRLDAAVHDIRIGPTDVGVHGPGVAEEGSHVVVTVPLGVLKRGAPRFSPELPPDRRQTIDRLGFGRYEKVVLRFRESFWRSAGWKHILLFPADEQEPTVWVIGDQERSTLTAMIFHSSAHRADDPAAAVAWILEMLTGALDGDCPPPLATAVTAWSSDPFTGGSYSHVPPGATPGDLDLLGRPLHGRVLFAGEHTQSRRVGYADGAMSSGIREAKRLIGQGTVTLAGIRQES